MATQHAKWLENERRAAVGARRCRPLKLSPHLHLLGATTHNGFQPPGAGASWTRVISKKGDGGNAFLSGRPDAQLPALGRRTTGLRSRRLRENLVIIDKASRSWQLAGHDRGRASIARAAGASIWKWAST